MTVRIINADVMDGLRQLEDESVHCVCTSPPYWGLRDYGVDGQIGLEATPTEFVVRMVEVFAEVRRVLRDDGTCWVNMGDAYASAGSGWQGKNGQRATRTFTAPNLSVATPEASGLKAKDLIGMPWRLAFALQASGWWLRSDIIWNKPNPMPESVTDRPTKSHEYVFLLTKSERYFYDAEAIREEAEYGRRDTAGAWRGGAYVNQKAGQDNSKGTGLRNSVTGKHPEFGRNKRSVWTIATHPYPEAHFATFPPELPEICIKAGTSAKGCCAKCGAPWGREIEQINRGGKRIDDTLTEGATRNRMGGQKEWDSYTPAKTLGWSPSCSCNADVAPCVVLDPFSGAGTTALVADRLQRNAIGIELNPEYAAMSEKRINGDRGGLLDLMEAAP